MRQATRLLVDDYDRLRHTLGIAVRRLGHETIAAPDVAQAAAILKDREVDLVISDLRMPGGSGLDLVDIIRRDASGTPVILLTAYGTVETAVQAMKQGAFDYLLKPFDMSELVQRIEHALELRWRRLENDYLHEQVDQHGAFEELVGVSPALREVFELVRQVAPTTASVVITGETGTGKELVARAIHRRSPRADQLLVPVNLAAVPIDLLESELFGHVRGAFTGAIADRVGRFEVAHGGTLFLDEIADAPTSLQVKLLRVLQDGVIERVGSNQRREVDVRLISATNRDLEEAVSAGVLRSDLYYRLRVVEITLPPLRERREDIPYLAAHFMRKFGRARPDGMPRITEEAVGLLADYHWPGNVRELENVIERAVVLCEGGLIEADHLGLGTRRAAVRSHHETGVRLDEALDRVEREIIVRTLEETKNVKAKAARILGVSERTLWYRLRKHGLS